MIICSKPEMGDHDPALLYKGDEQSEVDCDGGEVVEEDTALPVGQCEGEKVEHLPAPVEDVGGQHTDMRYSVHHYVRLLDIYPSYRGRNIYQSPEGESRGS